MHTLAAIIALLMLVSIITMLVQDYSPPALDDSLYRYQLAGDVWRVLYLRGDFSDFDFAAGNKAHERMEKDLEQIETMTGFCSYISGVRASSCRGQAVSEALIRTRKVAIVGGKVKEVSVLIAYGS